MLTPEQLKLKQLLSEAILLLCKSGLPFDSELSVQALVGITRDQSDVCLISVHEVVHTTEKHQSRSAAVYQSEKPVTGESPLDSKLTPHEPPAYVSFSENSSFQNETTNSMTCISVLDTSRNEQGVHRFREKKSQSTLSADDVLPKYEESSPACDANDGRKRRDVGRQEAVGIIKTSKRQRLGMSADRSSLSSATLTQQHCRLGQVHCSKTAETDSSHHMLSNKKIRAKQVHCSISDQQLTDANESKQTAAQEAVSLTGIEIKIEQSEEEEGAVAPQKSCRNEFSLTNFVDSFQGPTSSLCSSADDYLLCSQAVANETNLSFPGKQRNAASVLNDDVAHQQQLDISVSALVCYHVLKYEGPFVPVRDIQRRRLRQVSAQVIKAAMNQLMSDGLGFYKTLGLGIMVFYKCPPSLVDPDLLEKYGISSEIYQQTYNEVLHITSSNRHTDNYWERITLSSPYSYNALSV